MTFKLKKGDKVGIIAPASKVNEKNFYEGLKIIKEWGLIPILGKNIFKNDISFFSASDKYRAHDLQEFLNDNEIKAIWCARGGYGTQRIINFIDWSNFLKKPKLIIGFSDITFLLNYVSLKFLLPTLHAPNISSLPEVSPKTLNYLFNFLFTDNFLYEIENSSIIYKNKKNNSYIISSKIFGGNLTLFQTLIGVVSNKINKKNILFFEEINEPLYRIDRIAHHLLLSQVFKKTTCIILGKFSNTISNDNFPFDVFTIFKNIMTTSSSIKLIIDNFPIGHEKENYPIVIGSILSLKILKDKLICCFHF